MIKSELFQLSNVNRITVIVFSLVLAGFVWIFEYPLNADIPLHAGLAKALVDILTDHTIAEYPYTLNLKLSSYAPPEMILAAFIYVFGLNVGVKLALSIVAIVLPWTMFLLLRILNPTSETLALIAFPIGFAYFFHLGFWPFAISQIMLHIALIHFHSVNRPRLGTMAILRFGVFLFHPIPTLVIGIHDLIFFARRTISTESKRGVVHYALSMFAAWLPALILLAYMVAITPLTDGKVFTYQSLGDQLRGVLRPMLVLGTGFEVLICYVPLLILTGLSFKEMLETRGRWLCAVACLLGIVALAIPRSAFFGSWEIPARVSLYAIVFLLATISYRRRFKHAVYIWVVVLFGYNLSVGFAAWDRVDPSFRELITAPELSKIDRLVKRDKGNGDIPMGLGNNAHVWLWSSGKVRDATTLAAFEWGPVRYVGLQELRTADFYYQPPDSFRKKLSQRGTILFQNEIYLVAYQDETDEGQKP